MQATLTLTVGKRQCSTLVHCVASSCLPVQLRWIIFNILHQSVSRPLSKVLIPGPPRMQELSRVLPLLTRLKEGLLLLTMMGCNLTLLDFLS